MLGQMSAHAARAGGQGKIILNARGPGGTEGSFGENTQATPHGEARPCEAQRLQGSTLEGLLLTLAREFLGSDEKPREGTERAWPPRQEDCVPDKL